ncbi:hypothetical protein ATKI12_3305 [Kitasatospora sp. Ki12]
MLLGVGSWTDVLGPYSTVVAVVRAGGGGGRTRAAGNRALCRPL